MRSFIGNQFRKPSGLAGRITSFLMKKGNRPAYDKIIPKMEIKNGDKILEIGYGHGLGIDMICKNNDCSVTGIDFSELMFKESKSRNRKHIENNRLVLHHGDYLDFNYPRKSFDKIFFINVIYFWNDLEKPFKKINEELKQNGKLYIYMADRDDLIKMKFTLDGIFNKYTIDQVSKELKRTGFDSIDYEFADGYCITCGTQKS